MDLLLPLVANQPVKRFEQGQLVLRQGEKRGQMLVLVEGSVEVVKNDTQLCVISERGSVFGEMSILLNNYHTATVRALQPSSFHVVENAEAFLATHSDVSLHIAKLLARRLALLNSHFTELKVKFTELIERGDLNEEDERHAKQLITIFWGSADRDE